MSNQVRINIKVDAMLNAIVAAREENAIVPVTKQGVIASLVQAAFKKEVK